MFILKKAFLGALLFVSLQASADWKDTLFATVINLKENDTLNVREKPNYRSKKTGALPLDAYVGVDSCKQVEHSIWCKVFHLAQHDYDGFGYDARPGWVNARYLKPDNEGYVIIDGKPDCDYTLRCQKGRYEVVESYETDKQYEITSIKTKWIDRDRLKASTNFGAMTEDPEASGYCTDGNHIQDYLHQKKLHKLEGNNHDTVRKRVIFFVDDLSNIVLDKKNILPCLHPKKGIVMTWNVLFGGKEDMLFGYNDIVNIEKNRYQKIHWGQTYGKGDDVFMSLYDYVSALTRSFKDISKIEEIKDLKGFKCPSKSECKGYEVFWINDNSDTKEYDWQGLVVILEKYHGKWYVVAMLRDRWTI
ncbi:SH3 domain-containing protein [Sulfurovum sp. NBC37-1]|uniref:SH3 domain-containing protein n=1 Tax=Sulfurovum sp. (strain NBC37-1) TaxID=387093 RepID=UPI00015879A9|nr:SH3 domain-containing protein [Sulfurovum sp. NBC37-1]BAF72955.1 hypothetical protein SUN_2013 [Sulfurovum sp. NBC37-1]